MLSLATLARWMNGIFTSENTLGVPDSVYDDIVPSGVHSIEHWDT
jgi:hypothetical protein